MSEMLGNQYFLSRNYQLAQKEFENSLKNDPNNLFVQKKLILCYAKHLALDKALSILIPLLSRAPDIITETDLVKDDCPCKELIEGFQNSEYLNLEKTKVILGVLWLYCDVQKALEIFDNIPESSSYNESINKIIYNLNIFN